MTLISYRPNPKVVEELDWRSDVSRSYSLESRMRLRDARQSVEYSWSMQGPMFEAFRKLIRENPIGEYDLPMWTDACKVSVSASDTVIQCETNADYEVGGRAIVVLNCDNVRILDIAAISDGELTVTSPVGADWPVAEIMPLRRAIVQGEWKVDKALVRVSGIYRISTKFSIVDPANLRTVEFGVEPMQITFAIDGSGSMDTIASGTSSRLTIARQSVVSALNILRNSPGVHDVHVVLWGVGSTRLSRRNCVDSDYNALIDYVNYYRNNLGTNFPSAFEGAASFYDGSKAQEFVLISDGGASSDTDSANQAAAIRDTIPDLNVHAFNIYADYTAVTDIVDNTFGTTVLTGGDTDLLSDVLTLLPVAIPPSEFKTHAGSPFVEAAGLVLEPMQGKISRAATFVDNGVGPIEVVETFSELDEYWSIDLRHVDASEKFSRRKLLHYLCGQVMPFWAAEKQLKIASSTTTNVVVEPLFSDVLEYQGLEVQLGDEFRTVQAAQLDPNGHLLWFFPVNPAPVVGRVIRLCRLATDRVRIDHHIGFYARMKIMVKNEIR